MTTRQLPQLFPQLYGARRAALGARGVGAVIPIPPFTHPPSEIRALQNAVGSRASAVDAGVRQCVAVDDATRQGWGSFYVQCRDFATAPVPDGIFFNDLDRLNTQGTSLRDQLDEWVAKLDADPFKCNIPVVATPSSTFSKIAKTALLGGLAVAGGYLVYKWIEGNVHAAKALAPAVVPRFAPADPVRLLRA